MQLHGIMRVMGLLCAIAALAMVTGTAQASSSLSAAAAPAASVSAVCSKLHASATRTLSSATKTKAQNYCREAQHHVSTVRFWRSQKNRWTLYLMHPHQACWELSADELCGPRSLCMFARAEVRIHQAALLRLDRRLKALLPKPQPHLVRNWLFDAFVCIHGGEGAWNAVSNTTPTYYGGLQMDITFQRQYGPDFLARWGTANHWPPWAQITASIRAHDGWPQAPDPRARSPRGFGPWPSTAPACGLH